MKRADFKTWITQGTYPRLFLPILLLIVLVTVVRYHYLLEAETTEASSMVQVQLQQTRRNVLDQLAHATPQGPDGRVKAVLDAGLQANPVVESLRWETVGGTAVEAVRATPADAPDVPKWFADLVHLQRQQLQATQTLEDGSVGRLTVATAPAAGLRQVWHTVSTQARISALNIFTILFLLTLLLRANGRMLDRLHRATEDFKAGRLEARMQVTGTLEARQMAKTFNSMAEQIQSLVDSLHATQRQKDEQLHFTRQLIDALPLPVFVRDTQGVCMGVNRAWEQLFDAPAADVVGHSLMSDFIALSHERPGGTRPASPHADNEIVVKAAGNQLREMCYFKAPFTSVGGREAGTISTLVDVTERKLAQAALRAEKERAEVTLASIGDGVITTDLDGHIESLNEVAQFLTGYTLAQAQGLALAVVFRLVQGSGAQANTLDANKTHTVDVATHVTDQLLVHRSGERYAIEYTAAPIRRGNGVVTGCVLVFRDVTETRDLLQKISWQALHDPLTGLSNRSALAECLTHALFQSRQAKKFLAVCLLDLDNFQAINERHGSAMGDRLLKEVAMRLHGFALETDVAARLGGDEFVVLLGGQADGAAIQSRVRQLLQQLETAYAIDDTEIHITASVGVAVFPQDDASPDTLLRHADQAMCQAKQTGRNRMHFFDPQLDQEVQTNHSRRTQVQKALRHGELRVYYQPKVNMRQRQVVGMEALIRWQHPEQGLLGPGHFLPLVENTDVIVDLGEWVLHQALAQIAQWVAQGQQWTVSVNIAARHFHREDFVSRLKTILAAYPSVAPSLLELEILESAALEDVQHMCQVMRACQALGVCFALDDFGTGFSSLSYLKRLPAETIKIDQIFIRGLLDDHDDLTLVVAIVGLATAFQRKVIAEGVETMAQGERLLQLGCELGQGFGIARPMPAADVLPWAARYQHTAAVINTPQTSPAPGR